MEHNKLKNPDYYLEINKFSDLVSFRAFYPIYSFISAFDF